jgi:predicted Zn-dependent protease with MMP-like domain
MLDVSSQEFEKLVATAVAATPQPYRGRLDNIAFLVEDEPTPEQAVKLKLGPNGLLFGLYEGVPLTDRGGATKLLPDKITIFRRPLLAVSRTEEELKQNIGRTVWHEIAHYFGLDHKRIHELENR